MNGQNNPNMNQGNGGIYDFPSQAQLESNQYNYAQPKTIYDDIKANPNYVPPILNPNPNYPPNNNNNIYPPPQNNFGYTSENNNIYSSIPQSNPGLNTQNSGNIYSVVDNRPAYIPQYAPNNDFIPKPSGDIPIQIQNSPAFIPQVSGNINPGYAPQTSGDINPGFAPQISGEINTGTIPQIPVDNKIEVDLPTSVEVNSGVTPQISGNIKPEIPPPTLDNMISPTGNNNIPTKSEATSSSSIEPMPSVSVPLLAPTNQVKISDCSCSCCSNCIDSSLEPLDSCFSKMIIIFSFVIAVFSAINSLIALSLDLNDFNAYLYIDISIIAYTIINCLSVVRIRCLRVIATILTVIFLIVGLGGTLFQYIVINTDFSVSYYTFNLMKFIFFMRLIFFALVTHIIFLGFWGINCCKNIGSGSSSGSSYRTHRTHFRTHHVGRSHFGGGHHSRPHHGGGHHHGGHHGGHGRRH